MNSVLTHPRTSLPPYSIRASSPALKIMHTYIVITLNPFLLQNTIKGYEHRSNLNDPCCYELEKLHWFAHFLTNKLEKKIHSNCTYTFIVKVVFFISSWSLPWDLKIVMQNVKWGSWNKAFFWQFLGGKYASLVTQDFDLKLTFPILSYYLEKYQFKERQKGWARAAGSPLTSLSLLCWRSPNKMVSEVCATK